ncbi:hypothetical protein [Sinorhizobium fredii]|uniref:hypothetical protein n=1 Tax=Rhizobium fredii TaxID=380 RepID=UPI0004B4A758|nr:hypothetical protein [Sinorhizobium fredii]
MNGEKVTGIVATVADSMKGNPSCLAAILLAGIFAVLTYFALQADAQRAHERFEAVMAACFADGPPRRNKE